MKKFLLIVLSCSFFSNLCAQDDNEYRWEIGFLGGATTYIGDANKIPFKNPTPAAGGLLRYRFDSRFALRGEYNWTSAKGEDKDLDISFDNLLHTVDFCGEFNFFDLDKGKYGRFSKRYSPYIFVGIGAMMYDYEGDLNVGVSLPFGVGIKVKLMDRLNFNVQLSNRLLFRDNMEGVEIFNDRYGLNGGNILNNDFISTFSIGLTFDFWKIKCDCIGLKRF